MSYLDRVAASVFPLSTEKEVLGKALAEWFYTGSMEDVEEAAATCELCDHPDIRYQFEIQNETTDHRLLVGSECIKRFSEIRVLDRAGRTLSPHQASKKIDADRTTLVREAAKRAVIASLVHLAQVDVDFDIDSFVQYYSEREAFTPKQMAVLIWRMERHGMQIKPQYFKVSIKRGREQDQLLQMEGWKLVKLRPFLSPSQLKWIGVRGK